MGCSDFASPGQYMHAPKCYPAVCNVEGLARARFVRVGHGMGQHVRPEFCETLGLQLAALSLHGVGGQRHEFLTLAFVKRQPLATVVRKAVARRYEQILPVYGGVPSRACGRERERSLPAPKAGFVMRIPFDEPMQVRGECDKLALLVVGIGRPA